MSVLIMFLCSLKAIFVYFGLLFFDSRKMAVLMRQRIPDISQYWSNRHKKKREYKAVQVMIISQQHMHLAVPMEL